MSMLAEAKTKKKRLVSMSVMDAKTSWNTDSNFGSNLMQKFGWAKGSGLGKNEQGLTAPIRPKAQIGSLGLGAKEESLVPEHFDKLEGALAELNSKMGCVEKEKAPIQDFVHTSALACKRKIAKNVNQLSEKDLHCIFGHMNSQKKEDEPTPTPITESPPAPAVEENNSSCQFNTAPVKIQDYFAAKMKALKAKRQEGILADSAQHADDSVQCPGFDFDVAKSDFSFNVSSIGTPKASGRGKENDRMVVENSGKKSRKRKAIENDSPIETDTQAEDGERRKKKKKSSKKSKRDDKAESEECNRTESGDDNRGEVVSEPEKSCKQNKKKSKKSKSPEDQSVCNAESEPLTQSCESDEILEEKRHRKKKNKTPKHFESDSPNVSCSADSSEVLLENQYNSNLETITGDQASKKKMKTNLSDSYLIATGNSPVKPGKLKSKKGVQLSLKNIFISDNTNASDGPKNTANESDQIEGRNDIEKLIKKAVTLKTKKSFRNIRAEVETFLNKFSKVDEPSSAEVRPKVKKITKLGSPPRPSCSAKPPQPMSPKAVINIKSELTAADSVVTESVCDGSTIESVKGYDLHLYSGD